MTSVGTFGGLKIVPWHGCDTVEQRQVRFPRSKRKRIRKKWAANPKNWESKPVSHMYVLGSRVLVPPMVVSRIRLEVPEVRP